MAFMTRSLIVCGCVFVVLATPAHSDDSTPFDMSLDELLEFEFGYRESIKGGLKSKNASQVIVDTIVAEDIADFPELNLAESIQRMPGISIVRESGEGRQISLRGLGPIFTRVHINGMETLAVSYSPMDSRNTLDHDRAFDFNVFASDLFSRIDIDKSYSAAQQEGGIGGVVNLYTPKPFDNENSQLALNVAIGKNTFTNDISPRVTFSASDSWGNWGALMSLSYSKRDTVEKGFSNTRWRAATGTPLSAEPTGRNQYNDLNITSPEDVAIIESGNLWFSRSNRYSVWENTIQRLGLNMALQYKASDQSLWGITYTRSQLENEREEFHLGTGRSSSRWPGVLENLIYQDAKDGETELVYAEYSNAQLRSEHRTDRAKSSFDQLVIDGSWQLQESLNMKLLLGWSKNQFELPVMDKVFVISEPGDISTNYLADRFYGGVEYSIDTTDPKLWSTYNLSLSEKYVDDEFYTTKLDLDYELQNGNQFNVGIHYKTYRNKVAEGAESPAFTDPTSDSFTYVYTGSDDVNWVVADVQQAQSFYNINQSLNIGPKDDVIAETSWSAYGQYLWNTLWGNRPVTTAVGLRYVYTDVKLSNLVMSEKMTIQGNYQRVLPTLNSKIEINPNLIGRLGISKNISRPYLAEQHIDLDVDNLNKTIDLNGNINPLSPYESNNIEVALEHYFSDLGFVGVGLFYKNITGFTSKVSSDVAYGVTGAPLSLLTTGQNADTIYSLSQLDSTEDATILGVEMTAQRDLDFLPAPYDRLGFIGNITWADGDATYRDVQASGQNEVKSFPGMSEWSGNLTIYYEEKRWGARLSATYRDEYISNVEPGLKDEDERGFHATFYVDMNAYYVLNETSKITLEAINLTNQREEQYSDSNNRPYNTSASGTSVYLGVAVKF
jgi:iron complex outermembrane receptor protein